MAVCRHCGAIIDDGLEICPDCGQQNTEGVDESYLDSLLSSLVESTPVRPGKKKPAEKAKEEVPEETSEEELPDIGFMTEFADLFEENPEESPEENAESFPEKSFTESEETDAGNDELPAEMEPVSDVQDLFSFEDALDFEDTQELTHTHADGPEETESDETLLEGYDLFEEDEELETEAYSIFDELEENDVDAMIAEELEEIPEIPMEEQTGTFSEEPAEIPYEETSSVDDFFMGLAEAAEDTVEPSEIADEFADLFTEEDPFALVDFPEDGSGTSDYTGEDEAAESGDAFSEQGLTQGDYEDMEDLFQVFSEDALEEIVTGDGLSDPGLEALLATEVKAETEKERPNNEQKSFWERIFGNVPVDPSKKKPEPTPEEIAAAKQKKEEEKKKSAEEKKVSQAEKKEQAKQKKEEKARLAEQKKLEKQQKKLEAEKKMLAEMENDTRINRVGATIVFAFFAVIAAVLLIGSNVFTYSVSIKNAKKNFELALDNDVKYYTKAYNHIYGLEMRNTEDAELEDKILTVMFVNKELNSYNSYMGLKDYESALHSLMKGLYRYGVYTDHAKELSIMEDMDFVRTQILRELEGTFGISEDESERIKELLYQSLNDDEKAVEYSKKIYQIVKEAENLQ